MRHKLTTARGFTFDYKSTRNSGLGMGCVLSQLEHSTTLAQGSTDGQAWHCQQEGDVGYLIERERRQQAKKHSHSHSVSKQPDQAFFLLAHSLLYTPTTKSKSNKWRWWPETPTTESWGRSRPKEGPDAKGRANKQPLTGVFSLPLLILTF